jgi:hypothetical protein
MKSSKFVNDSLKYFCVLFNKISKSLALNPENGIVD